MKKVVIISGPTAVGKTNISIKLAKALNGEIISADSVQVYRGMDIGSDKIKPAQMQGIEHYLVDCLNPDEEFDVSVFQRMAGEAIDAICAKGKLPIIVGGTAFYIQALLNGVDFTGEDHDDSFRNEASLLDEDTLYEKLKEVDPVYASTVHKNNKKRVIRALEYNHFTGGLFSEYNGEQSKKEPVYDFRYFVLNDERQKLYDRIERRVDEMVNEGLVDEVKSLLEKGYDRNLVSMQGIGYKEICGFLQDECTLDEAVELIKKNTRHFAKRQLTWLRHEEETIFINKPDYDYDDDKIVEEMKRIIGDLS